jgi:peptidoglycan L-alanyl-D-glutamate endopeptidase CwlK
VINSRALTDLHPIVRKKCEQFKAACKKVGIDVLITSTYRDPESQSTLFAQGRTTKGVNPRPEKPLGDTVTDAKPGQSFHNFRCAFDFCPVVAGKCMWNDKVSFTKCGLIAESFGLEWAGRWTKRKELAHCQYTGGLTLADLQQGKEIV